MDANAEAKTGHTPGPWTANMHNGCSNPFVTRADNEHGWVCDVGPAPIDNRAEREANAKLIAAAPDLLDALKSCQMRLFMIDGNYTAEYRAASAAITKAIGA